MSLTSISSGLNSTKHDFCTSAYKGKSFLQRFGEAAAIMLVWLIFVLRNWLTSCYSTNPSDSLRPAPRIEADADIEKQVMAVRRQGRLFDNPSIYEEDFVYSAAEFEFPRFGVEVSDESNN
jgi:hypothetical protein